MTVTAITMVCELHNVTSGTGEAGLDGKSALEALSNNWEPKPNHKDFDLIFDTREKLRELQQTWGVTVM